MIERLAANSLSLFSLGVAIVLFAGAILPATAQGLDLVPQITGIILDSNPQNGVGEETATDFFGVMNRAGREDRAVAEFDITGLTALVDTAAFSSGPIGGDTTGATTVQLWGYVGDVAVGIDDWFSGDELQETFANGLDQAFDIDVTDYVAGDPIVGFALRQTSVQLGRKDWVDQLLIVVPEPSAELLQMSAFGTLLLCLWLRSVLAAFSTGRLR